MPIPTSFSLSKSTSWYAKTGMNGTFHALTIPSCRVDVSVTILECGLDGGLDIAWFGLPSSCRGSFAHTTREYVWGLEMSTKSDKRHDSSGFQLCDFLNWHFAFRCGDVCFEMRCRSEGDKRFTIRQVTLPCPSPTTTGSGAPSLRRDRDRCLTPRNPNGRRPRVKIWTTWPPCRLWIQSRTLMLRSSLLVNLTQTDHFIAFLPSSPIK
jgi:hypothetical protein